MPKSLFGEKLTEIKKSAKITHFHQILGLSKGTYSNYVNGSTKPDIDFLMRLSNCVARKVSGKLVDMNWLIDDFDNRLGPVFVDDQKESPSSQPEKPEDVPAAPAKPQPVPDPLLTAFPAGAKRMKPRPAKVANTEWWQDDSPTWQVTGGAAAGSPDGGWQGDEYYDETVAPPEGITLVPVDGDSMTPLLLSGQYALIDKEREGFEINGGIVVAVIVGDDSDTTSQTYVKRCYVDNDVYHLVSINKQYQSFAVKRSRCRIWPVIGTWFAGKGKPPGED